MQEHSPHSGESNRIEKKMDDEVETTVQGVDAGDLAPVMRLITL